MPTQPEIDAAEQRLLHHAAEKDDWSPKELRQQARNGDRDALPVESISLAFWRLLNRGELVLDSQRRVRLPSVA